MLSKLKHKLNKMKNILIKVDEKTHEELTKIAKTNNRSLCKQVSHILQISIIEADLEHSENLKDTKKDYSNFL